MTISPDKSTKNSLKVALWGGKHLVYLPFHVAMHSGFFEEEGIDIQIYPAGNDNEIFEEVYSNRADLSIGDPTFITKSQLNAKSPRLIAALAVRTANWGYTHHPEIQDFKDITDFVALRFGSYPNPSTNYILLAALKERYPKILKSMEIVEASIGHQANLLVSDKADVVVDIEPMVSYAKSLGYKIVCSLGNFYPQLLYTGITASGEALGKKQNLIFGFTRALQKGLTASKEGSEMLGTTAQLLFPSLSKEVLNKAIDRLIVTKIWPENAIIQHEHWQNALNLRKTLQAGNIEDFLEQRFAVEAF